LIPLKPLLMTYFNHISNLNSLLQLLVDFIYYFFPLKVTPNYTISLFFPSLTSFFIQKHLITVLIISLDKVLLKGCHFKLISLHFFRFHDIKKNFPPSNWHYSIFCMFDWVKQYLNLVYHIYQGIKFWHNTYSIPFTLLNAVFGLNLWKVFLYK